MTRVSQSDCRPPQNWYIFSILISHPLWFATHRFRHWSFSDAHCKGCYFQLLCQYQNLLYV